MRESLTMAFGCNRVDSSIWTGFNVKQPLVLIPGLLCDASLWGPQVEALSDVADIWIPDLREQRTMREMGEAVCSEAPFERFALAGLSMGGYVGMEVMRSAPERVTRIALLDTRAGLDSSEESSRRHELMRLAQTARGFTPITNRLLPLLVHPSRVKDPRLTRIIRRMAQHTGIDGFVRQQSAILSRSDSGAVLSKVRVPTLVLCGREDALTPLPMHEEMARIVPGAKLVVVEQCGHLSTLEKPAEVNAALREWLAARSSDSD